MVEFGDPDGCTCGLFPRPAFSYIMDLFDNGNLRFVAGYRPIFDWRFFKEVTDLRSESIMCYIMDRH
jgi:hypothetical protein